MVPKASLMIIKRRDFKFRYKEFINGKTPEKKRRIIL
jgi:hypothetical protein